MKEKKQLQIDKRDELISLVRGYTFMNDYKTFYQQKHSKIEYAEINHFVIFVKSELPSYLSKHRFRN